MASRITTTSLIALALCYAAFGQTKMSIFDATRRSAPDGAPDHEGAEVIVRGTISARPIRLFNSVANMPLQDAAGHGLMLEADPVRFDELRPGDVMDVRGTISVRAGLPVLLPLEMHRLKDIPSPPPAPQAIRLRDVNSSEMLARYVVTEGRIASVTQNDRGDIVELVDNKNTVQIFLPLLLGADNGGLKRFNAGDRVRVTGVTTQYCPTPPYDRSFQILVASPDSMQLLEHIWLIPPQAIMASIVFIMAAALVWWFRERRMARQRRLMRGLNMLAEEIVASHSLADITSELNRHLPELAASSAVHLFTYQPARNQLERVAPTTEPATMSIEAPEGPIALLASLCFRNRTLLHIPDSRSSALLRQYDRSLLPRAMVFVPLMAQGELLGVMQVVSEERTRLLNPEEQAAIQHLGNQIAIAIRLREQQSIREQLFRSERLAAAGQLISGVASELRGPLQSINALVSHLLTADGQEPPERELRAIKTESTRAADLVTRLVAFTKAESTEQKKVNLLQMLSGLVELRSREWQSQGVRVKKLFDSTPIFVLAVQSQLEQVFLSLLVHAEQSLSPSGQRVISLTTDVSASHVNVTVGYLSATQAPADPFAPGANGEGLGLAVCRGIVQSQGGQLRSAANAAGQMRFDVELPLASPPAGVERRETSATPRKSARSLTILLLEPDGEMQQRLLSLFSAYRHRVVPMKNAAEAKDVAQRMRFDLAFCALRLPDASWVEVFDRIRPLIGTFVLLTDAYDPDLAQAVQLGDGFLLTKPVEEGDLERLLATVEDRMATAGVKGAKSA